MLPNGCYRSECLQGSVVYRQGHRVELSRAHCVPLCSSRHVLSHFCRMTLLVESAKASVLLHSRQLTRICSTPWWCKLLPYELGSPACWVYPPRAVVGKAGDRTCSFGTGTEGLQGGAASPCSCASVSGLGAGGAV